jgi:hypothetical protein
MPNENPAPPPVELYINEFMASNDAAFPGPQGDYPDWIEIYNAGTEDVMLGGYYLGDDLTHPEAMYQIPDTYPDSVTVPAGGFILFYANKDEEWSVLNLNFKLSGSGEQIGLWSPEQVILDSITYPEVPTDTSYGRYPDGTDVWYLMPDYTPGMPNTNPNPGPGEVMLYINEFMASNATTIADEYGEYDDWIEIFNNSAEPVWLGDKYLTDNFNNPDKWQFPDYTIPAGGFLLVWADDDPEQGDFHTNFKLSKNGEEIALNDSEATGFSVIDSYVFGPQNTDISEGRDPDAGEDWIFYQDATPGISNELSNIVATSDAKTGLKVFPNPSVGQFVYFSEQASGAIYNLTGRRLLEFNSVDYINIRGLGPGIYLLRAHNNGITKFIIQ